MVNLIHKRAEAHAIAQEHKLVLVLRALLPGTREEFDRLRPLLVRELRLARERVQVRDEGRDELERARVLAQALVQLLHAARVPANMRRAIEMRRSRWGAHWSVIV